MANLNKVMLIGRLTRDPEVRTFSTGGKVAKFGFAVNNKKKNDTTGQWEDVPVFVDISAFNREKGRQLADLVEQYLHKGNQAYIEGHLTLDQWTTPEGQKRSMLKVILDDLQFLEARAQSGMNNEGSGMSRATPPARQPMNDSYSAPSSEGYQEPEMAPMQPAQTQDGDIPF
jgi:single-strand DNA-binding protein